MLQDFLGVELVFIDISCALVVHNKYIDDGLVEGTSFIFEINNVVVVVKGVS